MIAITLLALILILGGLMKVLPTVNTPTLNVILGIAMVIDGVLFLIHL